MRKQVHPDFITYTHRIADHATYKGMPDLIKNDGEIQWEAPSNRQGGKFKDTHHKRREWWKRKAIEIGIDPASANWISTTAKAIHPFGKKPCGVCGRVMELRYAYPSSILLNRVKKLPYYVKSFKLDELEHIHELVKRLVAQFGERVYDDLPLLLQVKGIDVPSIGRSHKKWIDWLDTEYMPREPSSLSPGAMSNPPDRLDGFHTYNRCCRHTADKGRHIDNLRSYTTDRRVFEFWNNGDWIAADRLMGQIRSCLRDETCLHGHPGPCSADHIGPLSLGFNHRPEFELLCSACNSAKNNRMTFDNVKHLRKVEKRGEHVTSWYATSLWNSLKSRVVDNETALRLSKLLRDNRHTAFNVLYKFAQAKHFVFLLSFLEVGWADYDIEFENLRVTGHITHYDRLIRHPRKTKYALEQKARHVRIALESLLAYFKKENRNEFVLIPKAARENIASALKILKGVNGGIRDIDRKIECIISNDVGVSDHEVRELISLLPSEDPTVFTAAKRLTFCAMDDIANAFTTLWEDERYLRAGFEFD